MEFKLIFLSGLIATSLMTLFSYLVSNITKHQFREPQLLNILLQRSPAVPLKPGLKNITGWIIHYSIGWLFVTIMAFLWERTFIEPSTISGAILGLFFGFIGIAGWKVFFYLSPKPPEIKFDKFYFQLIIAHIIFGIGAVLPYL